MTLWIDTVQSPPVDAMRAAGVEGLCRYLANIEADTAFKRITADEYARLVAGGYQPGTELVLNFEQGARDWLLGGATGTAQAATAIAEARALGYPAGAPLPGSADLDMTRYQWLAGGRSFARAWDVGLTVAGFWPGVYGPWDVLQWYHDEINPKAWFWQSMSTSYSQGRNAQPWPGAHLRQFLPTITIGGQQCDQNTISNDWRQQMAFFDDPNAAALGWRMDALEAGSDTVRGGPMGPQTTNGATQPGEGMWLVTAVKDIQTKVAALAGPAAVDTHALATELITELEAAGILTADGAHQVVKAVLDAKLAAAQAA